MFESKILFGDYHEMGRSGRGYKQLTSYSRFMLFKPADITILCRLLQSWSLKVCLYTFIFPVM